MYADDLSAPVRRDGDGGSRPRASRQPEPAAIGAKPYAFYLHDGLVTTPQLMIEFLPTTEEAIAFGRRLLCVPSRYTTVEISQDGVEIAVLRDEAI